MAKISTRFVCQTCGYETSRWIGKCPECSAYNTFAEEKGVAAKSGKSAPRVLASGGAAPAPQSLSSVDAVRRERMKTGIGELDRVLGGGVVAGSLVLIGGDPGIGKSTLLLEAAVRLAENSGSGLYVSGEESAEQIRLRADRLGLSSDKLSLVAETDLAQIENLIRSVKPAFAIIDSIQTVAHPNLDSAPGTLTQVREGATLLQRIAKESGIAIFLVGHVNKEGNLAGPRALEHIVDAVLQLEGDTNYNFRILRALKNRFGSTNELGVFEMRENGMRGVDNPSQLFLSERQSNAPGSVVVSTIEGSRPLLVEVQALCAPSYFSSPRRTVTGADFNRVNVALAVIEKRLGMRLGDMDVYVNVVGGVRVAEPALDLGIALAVVSSLHDAPVPADVCVFGEVGLAGEVRAVAQAERRILEAERLGFSRCVLPQAALSKMDAAAPREYSRHGVKTLEDAVSILLPQTLGKRRPRSERPEKNDNARGKARRGERENPPEQGASQNENDVWHNFAAPHRGGESGYGA